MQSAFDADAQSVRNGTAFFPETMPRLISVPGDRSPCARY